MIEQQDLVRRVKTRDKKFASSVIVVLKFGSEDVPTNSLQGTCF